MTGLDIDRYVLASKNEYTNYGYFKEVVKAFKSSTDVEVIVTKNLVFVLRKSDGITELLMYHERKEASS